MSRSWGKGKDQPPFEEWDGSSEAFKARDNYDRRARRGPASASSREIDRLIESAVREHGPGPGVGWRQPVSSTDPLRTPTTLEQVRTLADLWSIWELAPAPREPGGRAEG